MRSSSSVTNVSLPMSQIELDNVINSVVNPNDYVQHPILSSKLSIRSSSIRVDKCSCAQLKNEINSLNGVTTQLNTKVEFLMSFHGLEDDVFGQPTTGSVSSGVSVKLN